MNLPWPEMPSSLRPGEKVREILDYLHWVSTGMLQLGARAGTEQGPWRERVRQAYVSLFLPPVLGHGDPYPPDVPPAQSPGIWPDVPAAGLTGMTLRHQLTVIAMLADQLRTGRWSALRPQEIAEWDRRIARARGAMDLGPTRPLPPEARTTPSKAVIADAEAREKAVKEHARRRTRRIQRMIDATPKSARRRPTEGRPKAGRRRRRRRPRRRRPLPRRRLAKAAKARPAKPAKSRKR